MTCTVDKVDFLNKVLNLWEQYPDLRFGQLLGNFMFPTGYQGQNRIYYQEDQDSLKHLDYFLDKNNPITDYWKNKAVIPSVGCTFCHERLEGEQPYIEVRNSRFNFGDYHIDCFRKKFIDVDSKY